MIWMLLAALLLPPTSSARVAARFFDVPEEALLAVTRREAQGRRLGVHDVDAWASARVCVKAKRVGWVSRDVDCTAPGWSTRGAFGLMAAYHLRYVGVSRWPWVLDVPVVSAVAAARKWRAVCRQARTRPWCPEVR